MPYGWRGLYALALIPLILIIPLRQVLPESARFEREQRRRHRAAQRPGASEGAVQRVSGTPHDADVGAHFSATWAAIRRASSFPSICRKRMDGRPAMFPASTSWAARWESWATSLPGGSAIASGGAGWARPSIIHGSDSRSGCTRHIAPRGLRLPLLHSSFSAVIPIWIFQVFFDVASSTIGMAYGAELFPTSYRSTAGSVLAVTGTTGGALGFFFEGVLYRTTGSHWIAIRYLTLFWLAVPIIMMLFLPGNRGPGTRNDFS